LLLERRLAKLGPTYANCPVDCTRRERDQKNGCPKCEYTTQRKIWEKETQKELDESRAAVEEEVKWPLSYLEQQLNTVTFTASGQRAGHKPRWSIITAYLVDIYRDEVSKMRAADTWRHNQDVQAQIEAAKAGRTYTPREEHDED
jgi:hypothetical protein